MSVSAVNGGLTPGCAVPMVPPHPRRSAMTEASHAAAPLTAAASVGARKTGILVLADGAAFEGHAFGAPATAVGEVCFNTAMTGYQEILADPSYAGQIIAF